ncbi:unnamed protein product [Rotaria sp. Silwood1]|nr:unnamed protein product [Rotaria sp. Silwood1]CAF1383594.1 unnamed protein product [Rotaria sp. Silwood1]CAF1390526.1 unnamed protein product [Rotaria sp. Silwood1]
METIPNEILLHIFSYLSWFDMLTCLWSLNMRLNSLVCSILSINNNRLNSGILITHGLSYNKCCSILFPLILNSSSVYSSIRRIHFDDNNSISSDLCYEWLFNDKNILRFPNLKSLILIRCGSIESVVQIIEKQLNMIKQLLCQLFSAECKLKSLRLDISNEFRDGSIQRCLPSNPYLSSNFTQYQHQSCVTLRHLHIRLNQISFFENLIEYVPNLEQMSVEIYDSINSYALRMPSVETLSQSNENWFNKVPKLRCFSLKTFISDDLNIIYVKWLLNNMNYVEKLQLHLRCHKLIETRCQNILKSFIDANFIRQYCLPDTIPNLIYFNFYICSQCQLSFDDIERITNSFKIHSFFIEHQWTNVKCNFSSGLVKRNQIREKVFANLISMTVQLKYLQVERFEWLLHIVQYIPDDLRTNALNTVRYAEFGLPSCHKCRGDVAHIGKYLVPFLSTYMPNLQTLRLWRPDDFPWTTIRPDYNEGYYYDVLVLKWLKSLRTSESIDQHVAIFEQDLCQLTENLKEFTFLDIYGKIDYEKVEPYRLMVQARFPNSRIDVEISRFRLWL